MDSDHDSIGAAVATITCNVLELVEIIQMINTILEENRDTIQVLIENIKKVIITITKFPNNSRSINIAKNY